MARNQTVTGTLYNIFALNRFRKECFYAPVRVDFSETQRPNNQIQSIVPFFNNDKNYYTPAFILARQKVTLDENKISQKNKFEARISHSQNQPCQQTPEYKPTDNKYCQLCQQHFQDYWEHINGKYHKRMINSSKFNKDIISLCQDFEIKHTMKNPLKTKKIEKKKADQKHNKIWDSKNEDKNSKDNLQKIKFQQVQSKIQQQQQKQQGQMALKKSIEQSLKITLQLGNYSTNLISNIPFKHICQDH